MDRRLSTGKILQDGKNEMTSPRNATHEGLKEIYFSLCFSLASLVGFASLQKNAGVLIPKIGEVKLININVTLRRRLFTQPDSQGDKGTEILCTLSTEKAPV